MSSPRTPVDIRPQPDDVSCGPTCLEALYRHYHRAIDLAELRRDVDSLPHGGTMAVFLALDALQRGFGAIIYTYNLSLFDPTWFASGQKIDLPAKLRAQAGVKTDPTLREATRGYLEFLRLGGEVRYQELNRGLLETLLHDGHPVLTGLSSTYLYDDIREIPSNCRDDDIHGEPCGHFVILTGLEADRVAIADPYLDNPLAEGNHYKVGVERLIGAVLLGALTYDANLLVIRPRS